MQSVQRQFGKLLRKGPGDNAKVSVLLNDYEDADNVLAKLHDGSRAWRDSWVSLVHSQYQIVSEYEGLYDPIVGATDGHGRESAPTPRELLVRTFKLKEAYGELKTELLQEIAVIDERILKPATDARDSIAPVRRTIKKRENKRMDYEKIQDKATKLQRKPGRTAKEDAALVKAEEEMARAADEFAIADEHIRATLPPIIAAAFSLVPPLVSNLALIQNRLLGLYYTTLNSYCEDLGFPSPPPPMDDVIATWSNAFGPIQRQIESIDFIARGKAKNMPMNQTHDPNARKLSAPSTLLPRRSSSGIIPSTNTGPQPRTLRIPSMGSLRQQPEPSPSPVSTYKRPDYLTPTDFTTATVLGGASIDRTVSRSPGGLSPGTSQGRDYFSNRDRPSTASTDASGASYGGYSTPTGNGFVKKKPPPPPPPKRIPSTKPEEWVVALYAFTGQGQGDLSFCEGDRIKIVKRTGTDQDWWVGELNGAKGNFPANYCKAL